jgi:hypothetical protein
LGFALIVEATIVLPNPPEEKTEPLTFSICFLRRRIWAASFPVGMNKLRAHALVRRRVPRRPGSRSNRPRRVQRDVVAIIAVTAFAENGNAATLQGDGVFSCGMRLREHAAGCTDFRKRRVSPSSRAGSRCENIPAHPLLGSTRQVAPSQFNIEQGKPAFSIASSNGLPRCASRHLPTRH